MTAPYGASTRHTSLSDLYVSLITLELARPARQYRRIYDESAVLLRLRRELEYRPPAPRTFPAYLDRIRERLLHEPERVYEAHAPARARHAELVAQRDSLGAEIDGATYQTSVEAHGRARQPHDAVCYSLSLVSEEVLRRSDGAAAAAEVERQQWEALERLQAWLARLFLEERRIKSALDEQQARGRRSSLPARASGAVP